MGLEYNYYICSSGYNMVNTLIYFLLLSGGFLSVFFSGLLPNRVEGATATLYFTPADGQYVVGRNFDIDVDVSSLAKSVNSVEGHISFPTSTLNVVSISKEGSIMNLWVIDPNFNNDTGKINFAGIMFNPGYLGPAGKLLTITFIGARAGVADVVFDSGRVLENDGNGTAMAVNFGSGGYTIGSSTAPLPAPNVTPTTNSESLDTINPDPISVVGESGSGDGGGDYDYDYDYDSDSDSDSDEYYWEEIYIPSIATTETANVISPEKIVVIGGVARSVILPFNTICDALTKVSLWAWLALIVSLLIVIFGESRALRRLKEENNKSGE